MMNAEHTQQNLLVLNADVVKKNSTRKLAFDTVREAFIAVARTQVRLYPVVIGVVAEPETRISIKSGVNHSNGLLGLKIGSYWPDNAGHGLSNHGSTTLLYHMDTGMPRAIINARELNGLRTAAANAVATDALARPDARTLAVVGTGHQAGYEVRAVCDVRDIKRLRIYGRQAARAVAFAESLNDLALDISIFDSADAAVRGADIIATVTLSRAVLFAAASVSPGTHISAMGADKTGKQELDPALMVGASLFADDPGQSMGIGEFQHVVKQQLVDPQAITAVGSVLSGEHPGRVRSNEITVFDSSGIAIQDLNIAEVIVNRALEQGQALSVPF